MSEINLQTAVLDACVLFPAGLRNLFMWLAVEGVFQAKWTADIHEEWIRNVLAVDAKKHAPPLLTRAKLERTRELMDRHASGSLVIAYEQHIPALSLPDPDDRHILAAAIECEAEFVVTFNIKDFPDAELSRYGVQAIHPDTFLCQLFDEQPEHFMEAVASLLNTLKSPPMTLDQLRTGYLKAGLTNLAGRLSNCVGPEQI